MVMKSVGFTTRAQFLFRMSWSSRNAAKLSFFHLSGLVSLSSKESFAIRNLNLFLLMVAPNNYGMAYSLTKEPIDIKKILVKHSPGSKAFPSELISLLLKPHADLILLLFSQLRNPLV